MSASAPWHKPGTARTTISTTEESPLLSRPRSITGLTQPLRGGRDDLGALETLCRSLRSSARPRSLGPTYEESRPSSMLRTSENSYSTHSGE